MVRRDPEPIRTADRRARGPVIPMVEGRSRRLRSRHEKPKPSSQKSSIAKPSKPPRAERRGRRRDLRLKVWIALAKDHAQMRNVDILNILGRAPGSDDYKW